MDGPALTCLETPVRAEWVDYNGHMNAGAYGVVFSDASDALIDWIGLDSDFRTRRGYTVYTLETHIRYLAEARRGQQLVVDARLVDHDAKRLHVLMWMHALDDGSELATCEAMLMGIDRSSGRPAPFPPEIAPGVEALAEEFGCRKWPDIAGRAIGIRRR